MTIPVWDDTQRAENEIGADHIGPRRSRFEKKRGERRSVQGAAQAAKEWGSGRTREAI